MTEGIQAKADFSVEHSLSLFPAVSFDLIERAVGAEALRKWGHYLEACNRPFGVHTFGLSVNCELVSVAVSASTPGVTCGGYKRKEVVELARLCSRPGHRDMTRVALRLWRKVAPAIWATDYWPVRAAVAYSDSTRHSGDIYRFDGWRKVADVPGGIAGGGHQAGQHYNPKSVWVYELNESTQESE